MSKTLAAEIASRTLEVVNPANRAMALNAALRRHGFAADEPTASGPMASGPTASGLPPQLTDSAALVAWLLATYGQPG